MEVDVEVRQRNEGDEEKEKGKYFKGRQKRVRVIEGQILFFFICLLWWLYNRGGVSDGNTAAGNAFWVLDNRKCSNQA